MIDLQIAEAAERDYAESLKWYAARSEFAAKGFEAAFAAAIETISENPERYPKCDRVHRYYLLKRFPFQLIFRPVTEDRWQLVAVAHTSRRPGYWSKR